MAPRIPTSSTRSSELRLGLFLSLTHELGVANGRSSRKRLVLAWNTDDGAPQREACQRQLTALIVCGVGTDFLPLCFRFTPARCWQSHPSTRTHTYTHTQAYVPVHCQPTARDMNTIPVSTRRQPKAPTLKLTLGLAVAPSESSQVCVRVHCVHVRGR